MTIPNSNIPPGEALWFFTPSQYRASGGTWGDDYGILTLPGRLGDTVDWFGRVTYSSSSLQNAYIYRRGYPSCDATYRPSSGMLVDRIDEPGPDLLPPREDCEPRHLYGNAADCTVGKYESQDSDGWSRIVHHSGGDSASPLYVYHNGSAAVVAIHFYSEGEKHEDDLDCTGDWVDRPLGAIRLTPQYRDLNGTFRSTFP